MDATGNMQNPYESGHYVLSGMNVYCENLAQGDSLKSGIKTFIEQKQMVILTEKFRALILAKKLRKHIYVYIHVFDASGEIRREPTALNNLPSLSPDPSLYIAYASCNVQLKR